MSAILLTVALALAEPGVERVEPWTHDDIVAHLESEKQQLREEIATLKKELERSDWKVKFLALHSARLHNDNVALREAMKKGADILEKLEAERVKWRNAAAKLLFEKLARQSDDDR